MGGDENKPAGPRPQAYMYGNVREYLSFPEGHVKLREQFDQRIKGMGEDRNNELVEKDLEIRRSLRRRFENIDLSLYSG